MPTTDPSSAPVSYSVLSPKSRIVYEEDTQGVRITILPSGMWQVAKWPLLLGVIALCLSLMLGVVLQLRLRSSLGLPVPVTGLLLQGWKHAMLDWEMILFLVFALAASYILGQERIRIEANRQQLIIISELWRWGWRKQWPSSAVTSVRIGWGVVKIYCGRWCPSARVVGGLSKREYLWLARHLREVLGLPES